MQPVFAMAIRPCQEVGDMKQPRVGLLLGACALKFMAIRAIRFCGKAGREILG